AVFGKQAETIRGFDSETAGRSRNSLRAQAGERPGGAGRGGGCADEPFGAELGFGDVLELAARIRATGRADRTPEGGGGPVHFRRRFGGGVGNDDECPEEIDIGAVSGVEVAVGGPPGGVDRDAMRGAEVADTPVADQVAGRAELANLIFLVEIEIGVRGV